MLRWADVSDLTLTSGDASGVTIGVNSLRVDPSAYNSLAVGESEVITYSYDVSMVTAATCPDGDDHHYRRQRRPGVEAAVSATATEDDAIFNVDLLAGASDPDAPMS